MQNIPDMLKFSVTFPAEALEPMLGKDMLAELYQKAAEAALYDRSSGEPLELELQYDGAFSSTDLADGNPQGWKVLMIMASHTFWVRACVEDYSVLPRLFLKFRISTH